MSLHKNSTSVDQPKRHWQCLALLAARCAVGATLQDRRDRHMAVRCWMGSCGRSRDTRVLAGNPSVRQFLSRMANRQLCGPSILPMLRLVFEVVNDMSSCSQAEEGADRIGPSVVSLHPRGRSEASSPIALPLRCTPRRPVRRLGEKAGLQAEIDCVEKLSRDGCPPCPICSS